MDCEKCKNFNPEYAPKLMGIGPAFLCRNYERKPPFSPGDLVMRKDGKEIEVYRGITYAVQVCGPVTGNGNPSFHDGMGLVFFDPDEYTLAPAKPTLDDYDVEGFRPAEYDDFYWACNDPYPMVIRSICKMSYPAWILRRKKKVKKVEFEGATVNPKYEGYPFIAFNLPDIESFPRVLFNGTPCKVTVEGEEE